jgi:RNA polymerase-interacting CarD/CdnL/TRCF family regulator
MRFNANEKVVHPKFGVGRVVKLETKQFGQRAKQEYYEIEIATGTVWVPVDGPSNGLRKITGEGELGKYRELLRGRPTPLAIEHKDRQDELVDRLSECTFQALCEVVRDLTAYRWNKPLNESSGNLLRNAHQVLCEEWAAAGKVSIAEANREIESLLLEGKQAHAINVV